MHARRQREHGEPMQGLDHPPELPLLAMKPLRIWSSETFRLALAIPGRPGEFLLCFAPAARAKAHHRPKSWRAARFRTAIFSKHFGAPVEPQSRKLPVRP